MNKVHPVWKWIAIIECLPLIAVLVIIIILRFFSISDPGYVVHYEIENNTSDTIEVIYDDRQYGIKENRIIILPKVKVNLMSNPGMGFAKNDYSNRDSIDFNFFYLKMDSLYSSKNCLDKTQWNFELDDENQCTYLLKISQDDFK